MKVNFILNHQAVSYDIQPGDDLLQTLRDHHLVSVKRGCDTSSCGVCTVLLNGKPVLSCSVLTASIEGKVVITVDGLQDEIEKIANAFGEEGADQCGFCNPGLALTIYALRQEFEHPTDEQIKHYVVGNLCRCSGYQAQFIAIKKYLGGAK